MRPDPRLIPAACVVAMMACGATSVYAQAPTAPQERASEPHSRSDQGGKQEPSAKGAPPGEQAPPQPANSPTDVFVNGSLNAPGADPNSQTAPAKFSERNDALDKIPIMGRGPELSDQDKDLIRTSAKAVTPPQPEIGGPATALPTGVAMTEWPQEVVAKVPALDGTKYVGLSDRVLVVHPANSIVVGEIKK